MTDNENTKPRVFWLCESDCDFDLNWKKIEAAEFPHKETIKNDVIRVIEHNAYEHLLIENNRLVYELDKSRHDHGKVIAELEAKIKELEGEKLLNTMLIN